MKRKKRTPSKTEFHDPADDSSPLLDSPIAILDEAVSQAARTIVGAASGQEVSREQLAAAQDLLNRRGITAAGSKTSSIPEAFARDAFAYVFRLLGFPPIKWPRTQDKATLIPMELQEDSFSDALQDN